MNQRFRIAKNMNNWGKKNHYFPPILNSWSIVSMAQVHISTIFIPNMTYTGKCLYQGVAVHVCHEIFQKSRPVEDVCLEYIINRVNYQARLIHYTLVFRLSTTRCHTGFINDPDKDANKKVHLAYIRNKSITVYFCIFTSHSSIQT